MISVARRLPFWAVGACAQKPDERKTPRKSYPKTRFGSAQTRGVIFRKNGQAQPTRSFLLQMSSPPKSLCPFLNGTVSNGRRDYTVATPGITCPRGFCKDFFSVSYSPAGWTLAQRYRARWPHCGRQSRCIWNVTSVWADRAVLLCRAEFCLYLDFSRNCQIPESAYWTQQSLYCNSTQWKGFKILCKTRKKLVINKWDL